MNRPGKKFKKPKKQSTNARSDDYYYLFYQRQQQKYSTINSPYPLQANYDSETKKFDRTNNSQLGLYKRIVNNDTTAQQFDSCNQPLLSNTNNNILSKPVQNINQKQANKSKNFILFKKRL